jgi:hypothetical protein
MSSQHEDWECAKDINVFVRVNSLANEYASVYTRCKENTSFAHAP